MKQIITCLILMLTFAACGDVAKKPSRMTNDESQMTNEEGRGTRSALRDASHLKNDENNLMNAPSEITNDELRMTNKEERTTRGDRRIDNEGDNMRGFIKPRCRLHIRDFLILLNINPTSDQQVWDLFGNTSQNSVFT